MKVLIVGASKNPERYAYKAMRRLLDHGHEVLLLNPALKEIEGHPVINSIGDAGSGLDTISLYVGPANLEPLIDGIIACAPRRIISNPGTESAAMRERAQAAGIEYLEACTLVMLASGKF